ncbi:hypothetical protein A3C98_00105 [Candidatus Roizmanbacteria bacterium RIFCSPHIGHO2_02_FULL_37_15]|uniref:Uncharacterized protein n=1 Tax=Candidatus Roizmanbacteria bacterium RIFCSPLOWO2_01_FULL_37_16 TaxID=1802058 RepID=A0A1F7IKR6_9BACT|nr:MAG: hypothetical protein A2859_04710 [Candidatus Roizmanbacteria bacterium RIFCSPHIGHO2_01_FULL_37_16b]OGK22280.1 MAG: hypothetical protein A3C98_00105 [Candidatus Roizmanbacteria bacterium RIFCSPHIGHO2_02_FULL_37_15]OGK31793.1 MAG: hypothetical protein A3F57_00430 [Candidatus Roizmanbacteria bacterium RIFCSPHIGHO2_12_FULL_36_11]OGK43952.1 MAG: hypothetical protein A3B40_04065 [Candidatus Roizmanbacteria bacterium RIFCSPLOWO2_01_FULL_37_16]
MRKIDYSIKRTFRENVIYIIAFFILNFILISSGYFFFKQYQENNRKIESLQTEFKDLENKKRILEFKNEFIENEVDLDKFNLILSQLIPNEEDYFSIIASLENLSAISNFSIVSYSIPLDRSLEEKLAIVIAGRGDTNSFMEFLNSHKLAGGRLITIDRIELIDSADVEAKIYLNVYRGKGSKIDTFRSLTTQDKQLLEEILEKVQIEFKSEEIDNIDYPTKSNPF